MWSTRNQEKRLTPRAIPIMRKKLLQIAEEKGFRVHASNGVADHFHALVSLRSTQSVAWVANQMKGVTSRWMDTEQIIKGGCYWEEGYGAYSIQKDDIADVKEYIENQASIHEDMTFEEEWTALFCYEADETVRERLRPLTAKVTE